MIRILIVKVSAFKGCTVHVCCTFRPYLSILLENNSACCSEGILWIAEQITQILAQKVQTVHKGSEMAFNHNYFHCLPLKHCYSFPIYSARIALISTTALSNRDYRIRAKINKRIMKPAYCSHLRISGGGFFREVI